MEPLRLAVIGAGTMGRGIAETAAVRQMTVFVVEPDAAQVVRAQSALRTSIEKAIAKKKIPLADPAEALGRIAWLATIAELPHVDAVIEAVVEHEPTKLAVFRELDARMPPAAVLASNTSSISLTRLAAATSRPTQVVGMHFFNPVPVMEPVEVVRALQTADETVARACDIARALGKQPFVVCDSPGFAVNRVLMPMINEAVFALQEGVADVRTIDQLAKLGCRLPMGPLELADFVGLDVCLSILQQLHRDLGDPKFRPAALLVRMVEAGRLGRKSGRGFYEAYP